MENLQFLAGIHNDRSFYCRIRFISIKTCGSLLVFLSILLGLNVDILANKMSLGLRRDFTIGRIQCGTECVACNFDLD